MRRALALLVLMAATVVVAGCEAAPSAPSTGEVGGEVIVSAAASLTEAFTDVARSFEAKYPGTKVTLNFSSSATLAIQINEGAPADVFASADRAQMDNVKADRKSVPPATFALNRLVIAKPKGATAVGSYGDLARPNLKLVLAADGVPVGTYATRSLVAAEKSGAFGPGFLTNVMANVRSREPNVRAVLAKVQLGEADAAIVYSTDIATAPEVEAVAIPDAYNVTGEYFIAPLTGGKNAPAAAAFVAFVRGTEGQALLSRRGFTMPAQ